MADGGLVHVDEGDESAPLLSTTLKSSGRGPDAITLIPDHGDNACRAAEDDAGQMFHEKPSEADLDADAPLLEKSDAPRPPRWSWAIMHKVGLNIELFSKLLSPFEWAEVTLFMLSTIALVVAFYNILSLWLRPSAWRRSIAVDDQMTSVVISTSMGLRAAVAVQAVVLIFGLYRSKSPRNSLRFLIPPFDENLPWMLCYRKRIIAVALLSLFLLATNIALYFSTPLLLLDLSHTAVGRPAAPFPTPCRYYRYSESCQNDPNYIPKSMWRSIRENQRWSEPDFSILPPALFPTFAEYQNTSTSARDTQPGVDDTGAIIRALFPIEDAKRREELWAYDGWATIVNSRVVCVRPTILDLHIGWENRTNNTYVEGHLSLGALRPSGIHHDRGRDPKNETDLDKPIPFRCYLAKPVSKAAGLEDNWPISLCAVGSTTGQPPSPSRFGLLVDSLFRGPGLPRPYVMANYSGHTPSPSSIASISPELPIPSLSWTLRSLPPSSLSSPWNDVKWSVHSLYPLASGPPPPPIHCGSCYGAPAPANASKPGCCNTCAEVKDAYAAISWPILTHGSQNIEQCRREFEEIVQELDFELHLSLCFPSFEAIESKISAHSATNRSELVAPRHSSPGALESFDSTALLRQLGVSKHTSSSSERGIMNLKAQNPWDSILFGSGLGNLDFTFGFWDRSFGLYLQCNETVNYYPHTYGLCAGCGQEMRLEDIVANGRGGGVPCQWWKNNRGTWFGRPAGRTGGYTGSDVTDERVHWLNNTDGAGKARGVHEGVVEGVKKVDGVLTKIFMDALKREGAGPARALQALFWVLNAVQYYHRLPHFNSRDYSSLSFFEEHLLPVRSNGLQVVSLVLGAHFLVLSLAVAVLILWRRHDRSSGIGLKLETDGDTNQRYSDHEQAGIKGGE